MIKELVLKKPIMAHNEKLHVLELREPSYDEIEAIGFPFTVSGVLADKINYLGNTGPANAKKISDIVTRIGPLTGTDWHDKRQ